MSMIVEGDREEGEIVDDEFEEISDNSIIFSFNETGKSLNYTEQLPVISLSSVSEYEDENEHIKVRSMRKFHEKYRHHRHHRHKLKKRMRGKYFRKLHRMKKWKRLVTHSTSSSFDSDESLDEDLDSELQTQLKAAIKVEKTDNHTNSLRNRLKAMVKVDIEKKEKTSDNPKSDSDGKISEQKTQLSEPTDEVDNELMQLRVEALRSAVLNKLAHRKKRKKEDTEINEDVNFDTNKENNNNKNVGNKKPCLNVEVQEENNTPPDEDEDILRAVLLASLSKKHSNGEIKKTKLPPIDSKYNETNANIKKTVVPLRHHIPHNIKPIIINVSSDSESEADTNGTNNKNTNINQEIENTVEHFLREQRARVEAQMKQKQISRHKLIIKNNIPKQIQRQNSDESVLLEKSSVRLLPKTKQLEYQRLVQKLKNAQKKSRIRKPLIRGCEGATSQRKNCLQKINGPEPNKIFDFKQEARTLHNILKGMQKQQNGRLQIEEKYVILTPIIRKINETTTERKKYDQEVKRLVAELAETRRKLQETHKNFSECVKELFVKKNEIDKSTSVPNEKGSKVPVTSTPNKSELPLVPIDITVDGTPNISKTPNLKANEICQDLNTFKAAEIEGDAIDDTKLTIQATKEKHIVFKIDGVEVENNVDAKINKFSKVENDIESGDPSDVNNKFETFPNYVSPLDNVQRKNNYDPFVIMCPYDINGNCRDPECTYTHYSR
ncbi:putative leucine-rich repeat-containing protein DDB_G0290503 [Diorhabda sublineata]|uniref:putative leucine-rich repeat-containing protein DDB_G0290503 n=1 Tax=Diorhabda sublineata TaxID=1163346 RepID=UPI0024E12EF9|nr:putative leucine-rich repeat-containing protein DDB_G0290503 [Diorhabda sublineata]